MGGMGRFVSFAEIMMFFSVLLIAAATQGAGCGLFAVNLHRGGGVLQPSCGPVSAVTRLATPSPCCRDRRKHFHGLAIALTLIIATTIASLLPTERPTGPISRSHARTLT